MNSTTPPLVKPKMGCATLTDVAGDDFRMIWYPIRPFIRDHVACEEGPTGCSGEYWNTIDSMGDEFPFCAYHMSEILKAPGVRIHK